MNKQKKNTPAPEIGQEKTGLSRRKFIRMSLLAAPCLLYGGTLAERLWTQEDSHKPLTVLEIKDISPKKGELSAGMVKLKQVKAESGKGRCTVTFVGVEHESKNAADDAAAIAALCKTLKADILCTEYGVDVGMESAFAENSKNGRIRTYFEGVVAGGNSVGVPVAKIEGWRPNLLDISATAGADLATVCGAWMLAGGMHKPSHKAAALAVRAVGIFLGIKAALRAWSMGSADLRPTILPDPLYTGSEGLNPIVLLRRNQHYAACIRRLVAEGYKNLVVVTGFRHTDATIGKLGEETLPSSSAFAKEIEIFHPDRRMEKLQLRKE